MRVIAKLFLNNHYTVDYCETCFVCVYRAAQSQSWLTVDGDGFPVLQNGIPYRHLHSNCTDAFPGERA